MDDNRFDRDFQAAPAWELRRVLTLDGPRSGELADGTATGGVGRSAADDRAGLLPRPLDLRVPSSRAVVAITGGFEGAAERSRHDRNMARAGEGGCPVHQVALDLRHGLLGHDARLRPGPFSPTASKRVPPRTVFRVQAPTPAARR